MTGVERMNYGKRNDEKNRLKEETFFCRKKQFCKGRRSVYEEKRFFQKKSG